MDHEIEAIKCRIVDMQVEHHDLDVIITKLLENPYPDQLQLKRLKRRRLQLKDMITKLKEQLIPDILA
ncbi:MAG: YdcH family protein [Nitrosomonadaceae bacterium]